jgi:hypothetical protein
MIFLVTPSASMKAMIHILRLPPSLRDTRAVHDIRIETTMPNNTYLLSCGKRAGSMNDPAQCWVKQALVYPAAAGK